MKYSKAILLTFIFLLIGCRFTFAPVLKKTVTIQRNVNINERVNDSIKKGKGIERYK